MLFPPYKTGIATYSQGCCRMRSYLKAWSSVPHSKCPVMGATASWSQTQHKPTAWQMTHTLAYIRSAQIKGDCCLFWIVLIAWTFHTLDPSNSVAGLGGGAQAQLTWRTPALNCTYLKVPVKLHSTQRAGYSALAIQLLLAKDKCNTWYLTGAWI